MARVRFVLVVILLGVIAIISRNVMADRAVNCGDVLGPGGYFQLRQNLDCPPTTRGATVRDGANLDLNGHIVTCRNMGPCIVLSGVGAQLLDGVVGGALHLNLSIEGTGHTVKNVTTGGTDGDVLVEGDNNSLINVMARSGGFNAAFNISGNNNQLSDSIAQCGTMQHGGCIDVGGDGNRLIDNFVEIGNIGFIGGAGLFIYGNHNVVRRNRVIGNHGDNNGIVVTGSKNDIRHNTALGNSPFDLVDTNGDCTHNTWKSNTFQTSDPGCIQ